MRRLGREAADPPPERPSERPPDRPSEREGLGRRLDAWGFTPRVLRRLAVLLAVVLVVSVGMLIHPAYVVLRAGPVYDTLGAIDGTPVIEVKNAKTYDATGDLYFTTVALYGGPEHEITLWEYLLARLQPDSEIQPLEAVYPSGVTRQQIQEQNSVEMSTAQDEAKAVAMRATGASVPETITVSAVAEKGPANGVLAKGDEFVAIGGKPVTTVTELRSAIQAAADGAKLDVVVKRDGAQVPLQVGTTVSDGRRVVGVGLKVDFHYPIDATIRAGSIGGPSAGLMFSLGLYDKLTPGPLTGGAKIAGTGTIADDGGVGSIGGIAHKMVGARDGERADWFLAPKANCTDVRGHVPDGLHVVAVGTFDEARHAVEEIAAGRGGALAGC